MPRKRHVSRNEAKAMNYDFVEVMPRKRHVSRNGSMTISADVLNGHASQEACE